jgi:predicted secreted protein
MLKYSVLILLLFAWSACYCRNDTIFITDDATTVKVKVNEPFVLKFLACPTCGYHWSLTKTDSSSLTLINVTSRHTSGRTDLVGGNVYEFWKFNAVAVGKYVLEFIYKRSWLKEYKKAARIELYVN